MTPLSKSVPPTLKKIVVFLRRAEELDKDKSPESRVVAYNCRQYAVLTGIPLAGSDAASKACLGQLLDELEKEKSAMSTFSKAEHWAICRKVADRVFDKADGEDRAGLADKGTAKTFYAAGTFYEILQQFYGENQDGGDDETKEKVQEEEQKRLYCKWKATDILNAIKEGREPTPGGYQQQQDESEEGPMSENQNLPTITESVNSDLPPAPEMPSSDSFTSPTNEKKDTFDHSEIMPSSHYDNVELNINGSLVDNSQNEDSNDIFISSPTNNTTLPPSIPPPSYPDDAADITSPHSISSLSESKIPEPPTAPPKSSKFSLFGKSNTKKHSKNQMNDAIELTKFALAALQKGDGEMGRQRLEQALGVLNK